MTDLPEMGTVIPAAIFGLEVLVIKQKASKGVKPLSMLSAVTANGQPLLFWAMVIFREAM